MEQKHLIIVDEQSQSATLDAIKNTLKNEGIDLVYKEINPANFQKRVGYTLLLIKYPLLRNYRILLF